MWERVNKLFSHYFSEPKEVDEVEIVEVNTLTRVSSLSTKLRRRLFRRAMKDLNGLQVRSKERLDGLNFTVDLVSINTAARKLMKMVAKVEITRNKKFLLLPPCFQIFSAIPSFIELFRVFPRCFKSLWERVNRPFT